MNFFYPILSIITEVTAKAIDKFNFKIHKINYKQLIFLAFSIRGLAIFLLIVFLRIRFPELNFSLTTLLLIIVLVSFLQNIFEFKGLSFKDLSYRQPISDFQPILASFLAFLIFSSEREIKYVIAICFGSIILYWLNFQKNIHNIDKGTWYILIGVFFQALLSNLYKLSLNSISPEYIILFRTLGVLILLLIFTKVNLRTVTPKQCKFGFISGILYLIGSLAALYSIKLFGLQFSILILMLNPIFLYWLSFLFLKEKIELKKVISSFALVCLVIATIIF
jgi:drug/metabolite transporter (DMT)-like permease